MTPKPRGPKRMVSYVGWVAVSVATGSRAGQVWSSFRDAKHDLTRFKFVGVRIARVEVREVRPAARRKT